MADAQLHITSRNYSSWSLRAWLLCQLAGLEVDLVHVPPDDPETRAELLLLSPSVRTPKLIHDGAEVWGISAIAMYLDELRPKAGLYPRDRLKRAHCASVSSEMQTGFFNLRSALPMNLRARYPRFRVFTGAKPDIRRVLTIWTECLERYGGPWLFGAKPTVADALYAPVATRFVTYDVGLEGAAAAYRDHVMGWAPLARWIADAAREPIEIEELDMEF
jgi:glutathione S-transferase